MGGFTVNIALDGLGLAVERLARLEMDNSAFAPLLDDISEEIITQTRERFDAGEGPDGTDWEPSDRAIEEGGQTLVDKGRLKNSLTYETAGNQAAVGTNVVYAAIHQFGGEDAGMPQIPARPYLPRGADEIGGLEGLVDDFISDALGQR